MTFAQNMSLVGLEARPIQTEYATAVTAAMHEKGKISFLNADTGVGKSLGYALPCLELMNEYQKQGVKLRIIIATHSHALMNQLVDKDFELVLRVADAHGWVRPSVGKLVGRANYVSVDRIERYKFYNASLSKYDIDTLDKLMTWDRTIAEYIEEYGDLPASIDKRDICLTPECEQDDFSERQMKAIRSDVVITTHAMIALDMLLGHRLLKHDKVKTILIVDEADALIDTLLETQQQRLNLIQLRNKLEPHLSAKKVAQLEQLISEAREASAGKKYTFTAESRAFVLSSLKQISKLSVGDELADIRREIGSLMSNFSTSLGLGVSDVRKEPAFVSLNPYFSRAFSGYIKAHYELSVLTSATLSITNDPIKGMMWARKDLGVRDEDLGRSGIFSPDNYGSMQIELAGAGFPGIYIKDQGDAPRLSGEWVSAVADVIAKDKRPSVVLTASHKESAMLAALLRKKTLQPIYEHCAGEPLRHHIQSFTAEPGLLITAAGHVGLDIRNNDGRVGFERLVITRVSYAQPDYDAVLALADFFAGKGEYMLPQLKQQAFMRAQTEAIRKMRQAMGRGIRSPEDAIEVVILDPRFPLEDDTSSRHAALRNVIPVRFRSAYASAKIHRPLTKTAPTEVIF